MKHGHLMPVASEPLGEHGLGGAELGEDDHLVGKLAQQSEQSVDRADTFS